MGGYIPNTSAEQEAMLAAMGVASVEQLFEAVPAEVRCGELNLPHGLSQMEVAREMEALAAQNRVFPTCLRGAGAYRHFIPATVGAITSKETFLTAYTPYQAEISQGVLQSIFEYQTMVCELTGMDVSNASVYDGATAAAEAVAACRERRRAKAVVAATVQPSVLECIRTYAYGNGMELCVVPAAGDVVDLDALAAAVDEATACVYVQHPNFYGSLEPCAEVAEVAHAAGAKFVMGVNPISLGVLATPRELGADFAVGEAQPLGLPLAFGGPYLGFMACTSKCMRKLPGRIVGQTVDHEGRTGYVLTLQAREQHIRREKASSNICSNQALCALAAGVYLSTMGPEGLRQAAVQSMSKAHYLAAELAEIGFELENSGEFFHEFVTSSPVEVGAAMAALEAGGILGGLPLEGGRILWCCTELNTKAELDRAVAILKEVR